MCDTTVLTDVNLVRGLVIDDDVTVGESVKQCFERLGIDAEIEQLERAEEIENPKFKKKEFAIVVLDVIFQEDRKRVRYLLQWVKKLWPDAVIVILSNYTRLLSIKDMQAADHVLNKVNFNIQPEVLIQKIAGSEHGKSESRNAMLSKVAVKHGESLDPREGVDLYKMTGYVLGQKGEHIEAVVYEEGVEGYRWRKILMLASLFTAKNLGGLGTPFVFRIFPADGKITAEVELNTDADEQADIPADIEKILARLDEQDEQLRRESADDR